MESDATTGSFQGEGWIAEHGFETNARPCLWRMPMPFAGRSRPLALPDAPRALSTEPMSYDGLCRFCSFRLSCRRLEFFARSVWRLIRLARLGKDTGYPIKDPVERIGKVIYYASSRRRSSTNVSDGITSSSSGPFVIISIGHLEFIVRGVIPSFAALGQPVYSTILRGQDIMAFVVLFAVVIAVFSPRRAPSNAHTCAVGRCVSDRPPSRS